MLPLCYRDFPWQEWNCREVTQECWLALQNKSSLLLKYDVERQCFSSSCASWYNLYLFDLSATIQSEKWLAWYERHLGKKKKNVQENQIYIPFCFGKAGVEKSNLNFYNINVSPCKISKCLIDFNGMSTHVQLLYAKKLGNCIHFM